MIRSDLENIGVRLTVRALDFATLIGDITAEARNFDGALLTFDSDLQLNLRDVFHSAALAGPSDSGA